MAVMAMKTAKWSCFLLSLRPEAKLEAVTKAGRVNLTQKSPKDLKKAVETSKKLWRHPSAAEADQI